MNNVSGYSPCPIYGQILSVESQMLFYAVGGSFLLCAPGACGNVLRLYGIILVEIVDTLWYASNALSWWSSSIAYSSVP